MKNVFVVFGLFLSTMSFAGQENSGVALCDAAEVTCQSADQYIFACAFKDFTYVNLMTKPNESSYRFSSELQTVPPGMVGAGVTYAGSGFKLHVNTDVLPRPNGILSDLTIDSLHLKDVELVCHFNSHE